MVLGGFASLYSVRYGLVAAINELRNNLSGGNILKPDLERDIPTWAIITLTIGCVCVLAYVNYRFTSGIGITVLATAVMLVMGFFFTAVASYIVGLVGNSNSPVSGMTITAVLVAGGMLWLFNYSGMEAMVATLGIAAIVCCVAATSGDVCNDLKTGAMLGAAPFRQQIMQICGVFVAAFVMSPVLNLLHNNIEGGIGGRELSAPQASLFASLARGFSGEGQLPWDMIGYGVLVGIVILIVDWYLKSTGKKFRAHLMPIAVGMYLPFGLAAPILIGGLLAHFHTRGVPEARHDKVLHRGILFSSGVIAGEALMSVGLACLTALGVQSLDLGLSTGLVTILSIAAAVFMVWMFHKFTQPAGS
jgi:putative OPT family oligopeptide transporter